MVARSSGVPARKWQISKLEAESVQIEGGVTIRPCLALPRRAQ